MWKLLEKLILLFKTRMELPLAVSVAQQEVRILPLATKFKLKLKMSFALLLIHTISCFLVLCWNWKSVIQNDELGMVRVFITLITFNCSSAVLSMHFVISFKIEVYPAILNPIIGLQKRIKKIYIGEKLSNAWVSLLHRIGIQNKSYGLPQLGYFISFLVLSFSLWYLNWILSPRFWEPLQLLGFQTFLSFYFRVYLLSDTPMPMD